MSFVACCVSCLELSCPGTQCTNSYPLATGQCVRTGKGVHDTHKDTTETWTSSRQSTHFLSTRMWAHDSKITVLGGAQLRTHARSAWSGSQVELCSRVSDFVFVQRYGTQRRPLILTSTHSVKTNKNTDRHTLKLKDNHHNGQNAKKKHPHCTAQNDLTMATHLP